MNSSQVGTWVGGRRLGEKGEGRFDCTSPSAELTILYCKPRKHLNFSDTHHSTPDHHTAGDRPGQDRVQSLSSHLSPNQTIGREASAHQMETYVWKNLT